MFLVRVAGARRVVLLGGMTPLWYWLYGTHTPGKTAAYD
jgi:hypothetical protein